MRNHPSADEVIQRMREARGISKYHVEIRKGVLVDVYDVLTAFSLTNPAQAHAVKKMLKPGQRGHKDVITDIDESIRSLKRAKEIEMQLLDSELEDER